jgi:hypothetical protein
LKTEVEQEVEGGWFEYRGELRFRPLGIRRVAHCTSCLFYRKGGNYCKKNPELFVSPDTPVCEAYINRTHWRNVL